MANEPGVFRPLSKEISKDVTVQGMTFNDVISSAGLQFSHASTTDSDYSASKNDDIISADTTTSALTVTLPSAGISLAGKVYIIKDVGGNAGTNNITVATEGSENIDGSASASISTNDSELRLYSDGSNLFSF